MPATLQHKLYLLENARLEQMAADPKFTAEFPFLRQLLQVPRKPGCGRCGGSAPQRASAVTAVKTAIAGLATERKIVLKRLLQTRQVRLHYVGPNGRGVVLTF